jgi:putative oxidoreductase
MKTFFATKHDYGMLLLRVGAGAAILPFGLMKIGLLGTGTFAGTLQYFTGMSIPWIIALLVIIGENLGGLSLIFGFCTRFCAASLVVIMAGAVVATFGMGYATGFVTPLLFLLTFLPLVLNGGGAWSVDAAIARKIAG